VEFTKHKTVRHSIALLIGAAAALSLAACGGSSNSSSRAAAVTAPPTTATTTAPPTTTTATTTAATTTAVTTPAGPPPCHAAGMTLSFLGGQGATGHGELGFALRNTGGQTCSTYGYPGVQFLDKSGQPLPTVPSHTTQDFFGTLPETALTVPPGSSVSFRLGVTHGQTSSAGCTTAYGLQVIPPNDTAALKAVIANGAYECQTATVSPLQRGTSAYP
jgi:Protein of unknown function (DUF4232)